MVSKGSPRISEQIREFIRESDASIPTLSKATGVSHGQIYRFLNNTRMLSLAAIDRLCQHFELRLAKSDGSSVARRTEKRRRAAK